MKLQIVEYSFDDITLLGKGYRYTLEIDGRALAWTGTMPEKSSSEKVYDKLIRYLANNCKEYNINHYPRYNSIDDLEQDVVFEKEVSDKFLKELFVNTRIKELEEDFKWT